MATLFESAILLQQSPTEYVEWRKKTGKLRLHPSFPVDLPSFVPFISLSCNNGDCVYDISQIREQYYHYNDADDSFDPEDDFPCIYCDNETVSFKSLITCPQLEKDFYLILGKGQPSVFTSFRVPPRPFVQEFMQSNPDYKENFTTFIPLLDDFNQQEYDLLSRELINDSFDFEKSKFNLRQDGNYEFVDFPGQKIKQDSLKDYFLRNKKLGLDISPILLSYIKHYLTRLRQGRTFGAYLYSLANNVIESPKFRAEDLASFLLNSKEITFLDSNIMLISIFCREVHHIYLYNKKEFVLIQINYAIEGLSEDEALELFKDLVREKDLKSVIIIQGEDAVDDEEYDLGSSSSELLESLFYYYFIYVVFKDNSFDENTVGNFEPDLNEMEEFWTRIKFCLLKLLKRKSPDYMKNKPVQIQVDQPTPTVSNNSIPNTQTVSKNSIPKTISKNSIPNPPSSKNSIPNPPSSKHSIPNPQTISKNSIPNPPSSKNSIPVPDPPSSKHSIVQEKLPSSRVAGSSSRSPLPGQKDPSSSSSSMPYKAKRASMDKVVPTLSSDSGGSGDSGSDSGDSGSEQEPADSERESKGRKIGLDLFAGDKRTLHEGNVEELKNFYSLLWYYYTYDKEKYLLVWKEYEKQFSKMVLKRVGFSKKMLDKLYGEQNSRQNITSVFSGSNSPPSQIQKKPTVGFGGGNETPINLLNRMNTRKNSLPRSILKSPTMMSNLRNNTE